jgi:hypothetical protein
MFSIFRVALLCLLFGCVICAPTAGTAASSNCSASTPSCSISGGFTLQSGQSIQAGSLVLIMQADGNLVLYRTGAALWASSWLQAQDLLPFTGPTQALNCAKCFAAFQTDGNLVLYAPAANGSGIQPYWASNTPGNRGATLQLSSTNPLSILSSSGSVLWMADTDPAAVGAGYQQSMDQLWQGNESFQPIVNMQIQTKPNSGSPFVDSMDEGTQIVVLNGIWYLFNREYGFAASPAQCQYDFARIVVRSSADRGKTWSSEVVIARPNQSAGECALVDGRAYWDADTGTWHYLAQVLKSDATWGIDHFTLNTPSPMAKFIPDSGNPVVKSGALWSRICGPGKSCPSGTKDEGTPEISAKSNGLYYVTFHGAYVSAQSPPVVSGYRGVAATRDFHTWTTSGSGLPNDAIWSSKDCQAWNVQWNSATGCIGGGYASSLITWQYTYMLIESADISLICTTGQNWVIGLARASTFTGSGHWDQFAGNPLMDLRSGAPCAIQYATLFTDSGQIYLSYWTLSDAGTFFHIARLRPVYH